MPIYSLKHAVRAGHHSYGDHTARTSAEDARISWSTKTSEVLFQG